MCRVYSTSVGIILAKPHHSNADKHVQFYVILAFSLWFYTSPGLSLDYIYASSFMLVLCVRQNGESCA